MKELLNNIQENKKGTKFFLLALFLLLVAVIFFITSLIKFDNSFKVVENQRKMIESHYNSKIIKLEEEISSLKISKDSIYKINKLNLNNILKDNKEIDSNFKDESYKLKNIYEEKITFIDTSSTNDNFIIFKDYLSK
jgi:demethoxyubiquinone hydroxylase (CLK1/Coq7/Cat5 family)